MSVINKRLRSKYPLSIQRLNRHSHRTFGDYRQQVLFDYQ